MLSLACLNGKLNQVLSHAYGQFVAAMQNGALDVEAKRNRAELYLLVLQFHLSSAMGQRHFKTILAYFINQLVLVQVELVRYIDEGADEMTLRCAIQFANRISDKGKESLPETYQNAMLRLSQFNPNTPLALRQEGYLVSAYEPLMDIAEELQIDGFL